MRRFQADLPALMAKAVFSIQVRFSKNPKIQFFRLSG